MTGRLLDNSKPRDDVPLLDQRHTYQGPEFRTQIWGNVGARRRFGLAIVDDVGVVFERTEVGHRIPASHRVRCGPGVVAEYHEMFLVRLDFSVVAAIDSRVLPQHPHRDARDVLRIRKPHQSMVKIADKPVWGVTGVQAGHVVLAEPARCKAADESRQLLTLAYVRFPLGASAVNTSPLLVLTSGVP